MEPKMRRVASPRKRLRRISVRVIAALLATATEMASLGSGRLSAAGAPTDPAANSATALPESYDWVLDTLRFEAHTDRFFLSLPTAAPWARQTLTNPPRVVLDLGRTLSRLPGAPGVHEVPFERGPVRCLRTSQYRQDPMDYRVRVVLELRREIPCEIEDRGDEIILAILDGRPGDPGEPLPSAAKRRIPDPGAVPEVSDLVASTGGVGSAGAGASGRAEAAPIETGETLISAALEAEVLRELQREWMPASGRRRVQAVGAREPAGSGDRESSPTRERARASVATEASVTPAESSASAPPSEREQPERGVVANETAPGLRRDAPSGDDVFWAGPESAAWIDLIREADLHFRSGRPDSARAFYERAGDVSIPEGEAAWAAFQIGNCRALLGDPEQACVSYRWVIQQWPESFWAGLARDQLATRQRRDRPISRTVP